MSRNSATPPPVDLSFLLNQASYALAAQMGAALDDVGLTVREYCVLWKADEEERSQTVIAELAGLDKTTMVVTLDALERTGYAERRVSSTDRRARVVAVTPEGRRLLHRAHGVAGEVVDRVLLDLDEIQRTVLVEALEALTRGVLATPSHTAPQRRRRVPSASG
ncbi:MarR family winged helix-turn-helix transcriptional regulator [Nocardioides sp. SR21]|uniref:MarR family winged helix-turn-helix transcriptional regulator n=1 Tax=Nocardioides sp. SR21 TaxID=2919501 RepID=UPI001FAB32F0|nr:MarR family transcriptional regulator [Nocardioides sp. SR21]